MKNVINKLKTNLKNNKNSRIIAGMALVLVLLFAGTYAWKMLTTSSDVISKITAGDLSIRIEESGTGVVLEKTVPMSYQQGMTTEPYEFSIINDGTIDGDYTIYLDDFYENITVPEEGKFEDSKIRYILIKDDETPSAKNSHLLSEGRTINTGTIKAGKRNNYKLYMWIDSRAGIEVNGQIFSGKIRVEAVPTYIYDVSGILRDENNDIKPQAMLAAVNQYGNITTAVTDDNGFFILKELPKGTNKVYYVPTGTEINGKTAQEIEDMDNVAKTTITAPSTTDKATLTNEYTINTILTKLNKKNNKKLKLGDYVQMTPTKTSYTTNTGMTGYSQTQTINPSELNLWRVISINDDGTYDLVSEYTSSTSVAISGQTGYKNSIGYLNLLAKQYENSEFTVGSRYTGYNGQTEYIPDYPLISYQNQSRTDSIFLADNVEGSGGMEGDTLYLKDENLIKTAIGTMGAYTVDGKSMPYHLASRVYSEGNSNEYWAIRFINGSSGGHVDHDTAVNWPIYACTSSSCYGGEGYGTTTTGEMYHDYVLRPIVVLKGGLELNGAGTKSNPYTLTAPADDSSSSEYTYNNKNIVAAYKYVAPTNIVKDGDTVTSYDGCITGEEASCEQISIGATDTVESGTIIKYKVNDSDKKYFYVLRDEENKLVLQQRENTTINAKWNKGLNNNLGPTNILSILENEVSDWTNVNDLTYTAGTTVLYQNKYTSCPTYNNCNTSRYTLEERTAKARMITVQEAYAMGCTLDTASSCPTWMYNNLKNATTNGGTSVGESSTGYWTMSTGTPSYSTVWTIIGAGRFYNMAYMDNTNYGARAVVEINK